jgi:hypothetical protein
MSISELGQALRRIIDGLSSASLLRAGEGLELAARTLAMCAEGSANLDLQEAVARLSAECERVEETRRLVLLAEQAIERYQRHIGFNGPAQTYQSDVRLRPEPRPAPAFTGAQVDRIQAALPAPVVRGRDRAPHEAGRKTHGVWFDQDGHSDEIISGRDSDQKRVAAILAETGMHQDLAITADVEMKAAARMRDRGVRRVTLVINNVVCEGRLSCDRLLPVLLPDGYELTVYGVDGFKKTYRGGRSPWWTRS